MEQHYKSIKRVLWIILIANLAVAITKIILGMSIKATSVLADGFHSLTDGSSNIIGLIGINFAMKPVDEDHPYGHSKYEMLGSLVIVAMLGFLSFQILLEVYQKFLNPVTPTVDPISLVIMVGTLIINLFVTVYEKRVGTKLNSTILVSDAMHTRSDVFVTLGVITSMGLIYLGFPIWIDALVSLIVVFFILKAAFEIFKDSSDILLDAKVVDEQEILLILNSLPEIKGIHHIRSRGTLQNLFIDMHVLTDDYLTVKEAHALSHVIEASIQQHFSGSLVQVISHIEPVSTSRHQNEGIL